MFEKNNCKLSFKLHIADYLNINSQNVFLFWKGRIALYAILKAIGIKEGGAKGGHPLKGKSQDKKIPPY